MPRMKVEARTKNACVTSAGEAFWDRELLTLPMVALLLHQESRGYCLGCQMRLLGPRARQLTLITVRQDCESWLAAH